MVLLIAGALSAAVGIGLWFKGVLRPEGLGAGKGGRDVSGVPGAVWFVCGSMIFLTPPFMLSLLASAPPDVRGATGSMQAMGMTQLCTQGGALLMGVLMVYLVRARAGERAGLGLRASDIWVGLACLLLVVPVYVLVAYATQWGVELWTGRAPPRIAHETLERIVNARGADAGPWRWVVVLGAVVLAPVVEELLYRVFLQSCLLRLIGSAWAAVLIASALFTAVHLGAAGPHALPGLFVLAVGMGAAYEKTRRLGVPIVMHVAFNAANVALALWTRA